MKKVISIVVVLCLAMCFCSCIKPKTLDGLGKKYEEELITQAKINAGTSDGMFDVVVLNAEETRLHISNYYFSPDIDESDIVAGLFVRHGNVNSSGYVTKITYYNFGLQFNSEQTSSVDVQYYGWWDTWTLDVWEENPTILFEYSIVK